MAELAKLNNIGRAKSQHQLDMEALQRGAMQSGSLMAPAALVAKEPVVDNVPLGEMANIEDAVARQQAVNAKNPSIQDKLNAVAKARAKFYGEGM
jgi:hypothetical protein